MMMISLELEKFILFGIFGIQTDKKPLQYPVQLTNSIQMLLLH